MSNTSLLGSFGGQAGDALMFRNVVINGNFDVWQRGTSFTGSVAPYYGPDRFQVYRSAGAGGVTFSRANNFDNNSTYYLRAQRDSGNTATNEIVVATSFETIDVYRFAGRTATLQVKLLVGANFSGTNVTISVVYGTGTDGNIANGLTGQTTAFSSMVVPNSTAFQTFSVSGTIPSNATQMGILIRYTPTGTAGANDWMGLTGVQLEAGPVATPFERRPIGTEIQLCQRYFEKSFNIDVAPANGVSSCDSKVGTAFAAVAWRYNEPYKVIKRTAGTVITFYKGANAGTNGRWSYYDGSAWIAAGSINKLVGSESFLSVEGSATGRAFGQALILDGNWTADAEL